MNRMSRVVFLLFALVVALGISYYVYSLLNKNPAVSVTSSRELAWFRLAQACDIPAEHVITQ